MTKLYIANTTVQDREMHYRLVGYTGSYVLKIPRGAQVPIPKDLTSDEIAGVIDQQEVYGMVAAADVGTARRQVCALYSIGKPVTESQMRQALERNLVLLDKQGLELRKQAAVGISSIMTENDPGAYKNTRVGVVEKSDDPEVNEIHMHQRHGNYEGLAATMDAPVANAAVRGGRRRRGALS